MMRLIKNVCDKKRVDAAGQSDIRLLQPQLKWSIVNDVFPQQCINRLKKKWQENFKCLDHELKKISFSNKI